MRTSIPTATRFGSSFSEVALSQAQTKADGSGAPVVSGFGSILKILLHDLPISDFARKLASQPPKEPQHTRHLGTVSVFLLLCFVSPWVLAAPQ